VADTEVTYADSFAADVGQTDFTKRHRLGAEVKTTDASLPFFELNSVDATVARRVTELPRLLKASLVPLACATFSTM
jgi:hypothetical protein